MATKIIVKQGDITKLNVDAVVNAANENLQGGGGVDWVIHEAAGEQLFKYFVGHKPIKPGEAVLSPGFNLPAKYIIHAVGPIYGRHTTNKDMQLKACYINSLKLAEENNVKTIAFTLISAGVYGFPTELAAKLAKEGIKYYLQNNQSTKIEEIIMVGFLEKEYKVLKAVF